MKLSVVIISFILFSIYTTSPLLCSGAEAPPAVLDITGKSLRTGTNYYILPVVRGRGGGLTLASAKNRTCPLNVVQAQQEVEKGLPLTLVPVRPEKGVIQESTDVNIKFSAVTICVQSTVWRLDGYDQVSGSYYVTTGGTEGNPGAETVSNWFKIEKYEGDYKLVFCPTVCAFCKVMCRDIGVLVGKNGVRSLVLSDKPFRVMFKQA